MKRDLNYKASLVRYIKDNLKKGYTKESLKWALISQDHSKIEVEKAIQRAEQELASEAPVLKTKPLITHEVEPPIEHHKKKSFWKRGKRRVTPCFPLGIPGKNSYTMTRNVQIFCQIEAACLNSPSELTFFT